jgi:Prealbumin-like fold domain
MTAVRKGLHRRRRIGVFAALGAVAAGLIFVLAASTASLPGSNFEIEDSSPATLPGANLKVDGSPPALDWANVAEERQPDSPSGAQDESFGQGTKEDTAVPVVVDGSIPPQKSDLLNFGVYLEENAAGRFLNLFWHRVQEPNGTTNMDFEFNKSKVISSNGYTPVRTSGDVLIQYDLSRGGTNPTLWLSRWIDGSEGGTAADCEQNNSLPCWDEKENLTAAGDATGSINNQPIPALESDGLGLISARTFGEAQVDLNALTGGNGPQCAVFGSAYLKSRSSDSFTSELKDFIPPEALDIDQCANVIIRKETDPASDPAEVQFSYTKNIDTSPASAATFVLGHGQNQSYDNVLLGDDYTVVEDGLEPGWDFVNIDCSASSGVTPEIVGAQITFDIDNANDVLDCTYHNRARGTIIVEKITDDGQGAFSFTSNSLSPSPFVLTTTAPGAAGKDSETFSNLVPGSYDVAETVPAGWNLVSSSCDDGSLPSAIGLAAGETVTCTFHDARERGAILIQKTRKHAAAPGEGDVAHPNVNFAISGGGLAADIPAQTDSQGLACVDNLLLSSFVGAYTVTESVPAGYHSDDAVKEVTVIEEGSCAAAAAKAAVSFHNTPLTNVSIVVDSQIDGGTASRMSCNGGASVDTGPDGDGSVTLSDLEPTAPGVTVTCTVIVDP